MNNNEIFEQFWKEYQWPEIKPVFFRLYYAEDGTPLTYTMEELPGKYVDITPEQYRFANMNVRVVNGKIIEATPRSQVKKIRPSPDGVPCHPNDVTLVDSLSCTKWKISSKI